MKRWQNAQAGDICEIMMAVVTISDDRIDLAQMRDRCIALGSAHLQDGSRLIVEGGWGWFTIGEDKFIEGEFEEAELLNILQKIEHPNFMPLQFSSKRAVDLAITALPDDGVILIDNDHGLLMTLQEVRRRIAFGEPWHFSEI